MPYLKLGIVALAATLISAPSVAEAQGFTQRGTRTGAIAGAIIGGLIGAGNDEALAGAAIGGVVGGLTGRAVGRNRDAQYWNGYRGGHYYPQTNFYPAAYDHRVHYTPATRVYQRTYYGGGGYYGGYGRSCPNRGW